MMDESAFALNQQEIDNATLLYLQLQMAERDRFAFRDLVNEWVLHLQGVRVDPTLLERSLKALAGEIK